MANAAGASGLWVRDLAVGAGRAPVPAFAGHADHNRPIVDVVNAAVVSAPQQQKSRRNFYCSSMAALLCSRCS